MTWCQKREMLSRKRVEAGCKDFHRKANWREGDLRERRVDKNSALLKQLEPEGAPPIAWRRHPSAVVSPVRKSTGRLCREAQLERWYE